METVIDKRHEKMNNKMMSNPMKSSSFLQVTMKKSEFYSFLNELNCKTEIGNITLE